MAYQKEDFIIVQSQFVGSKHSSETSISPMVRYYGSQQPAKYERYYRPVLQLFKPTQRDNAAHERSSHRMDSSTFILPLADMQGPPSNSALGSQTFHGRRVGAEVNMSLVRQWLRSCDKDHVKTDNPGPGDAWVGHKAESCVPKPRRAIPCFRLIDVNNRCVVLAQDADQYAALSYVWGPCKRLLLTRQTLDRLSSPGALPTADEDVPQTFRDALWVADQLGIPFLWIDALCVMQDNDKELAEHMGMMDSIYSSSTLTIVSDTASAGNGVPGISVPRCPPQAIFKHGTNSYISTRRTFGAAMRGSYWESRAWCLQEKLFSRRLLVFTDSQVFYHCNWTTWFEDTILDAKEQNTFCITLAERASPYKKSARWHAQTAYDTHRALFEGRNFWSLVEGYTKRHLSFDSDAIRAFSGILKSVESTSGPAHWGVPEYSFTRGITWSQSRHGSRYRRPQFPSWSWAGWRGDGGLKIRFGNVRTQDVDSLNIDWHFHNVDIKMGTHELTPMKRQYTSWSRSEGNTIILRRPKHETGTKSRPEPASVEPDHPALTHLIKSTSFFTDQQPSADWQAQASAFRASNTYSTLDRHWGVPGHPGEEDFVDQDLPPFIYDSERMPPLSHIIRFFTSFTKLRIDTEPDAKYNDRYGDRTNQDGSPVYYGFRARQVTEGWPVGHVKLDPSWDGIGKEHDFIFVSQSFWPPGDSDTGPAPRIIWVMLLGDVQGAPDLKERVQLCEPMTMAAWVGTRPVWKCVNLA
ncbi:hypothetical protein OQA88_13309 [Cercophora sp. LCS_1]